jgi:hypothetical protein
MVLRNDLDRSSAGDYLYYYAREIDKIDRVVIACQAYN